MVFQSANEGDFGTFLAKSAQEPKSDRFAKTRCNAENNKKKKKKAFVFAKTGCNAENKMKKSVSFNFEREIARLVRVACCFKELGHGKIGEIVIKFKRLAELYFLSVNDDSVLVFRPV